MQMFTSIFSATPRVISNLALGAALSLSAMNASADPAPFGLEIGKATIAEMKSKYRAELTGTNKYSHGEMFNLPTAQLGFDGLKEATVIFDKNEVVSAILLSFPKHRFDSLHGSLKGKYRVTQSQIPFVGNKKVVLKDGQTEITLNAPHLSFEMSLNYISDDLLRAFNQSQAQEAQQKRQSENSKL